MKRTRKETGSRKRQRMNPYGAGTQQHALYSTMQNTELNKFNENLLNIIISFSIFRQRTCEICGTKQMYFLHPTSEMFECYLACATCDVRGEELMEAREQFMDDVFGEFGEYMTLEEQEDIYNHGVSD